ncbi:MAG: hypothetical protein WCP97_01385 [bacterium]
MNHPSKNFNSFVTKCKQWITSPLANNHLRLLSLFVFLTSLVIGFGTRIVAVFQDTESFGDVARDLYVYQGMWKGTFPLLGPESSFGLFHLPPLYYYLVWPFTIFSPNPIWPALVSAALSFLSIPLFAFLVYKLLQGTQKEYRFFLSALAGLWWSCLFPDVLLANRAWNPSPSSFFLFAFILTWNWLWESIPNYTNPVKNTAQPSPKKQLLFTRSTLLWALYGFLFSLLTSMHSSLWFLLPLLFIGTLLLFSYAKRNYIGPVISLLVSTLFALPYLVGESNSSWGNTKKLVEVLTTQSTKSTLFSVIDRLFFTLFENSKLAYFFIPNLFVFACFFVTVVALLSLLSFKGNKTIYYSFIWLYGLFLLIAANFQGPLYIHYLLPICSLPVTASLTALAYFPFNRNVLTKLLAGFIIFSLLLSFYANMHNLKAYLSAKYGPVRLVNTQDIIDAIKEIPTRSIVCVDPRYLESYHYIDEFITKNKIVWHRYGDCQQSQIYLLRNYALDIKSIDIPHDPRQQSTFYYNYIHTGPVKQTMSESGWVFWKEVGNHQVFKAVGQG